MLLILAAQAAELTGRWQLSTPEAEILAQQEVGLQTALASLPSPIRLLAAPIVRRTFFYCQAYDLVVTDSSLTLACDDRALLSGTFGAPAATREIDGAEVALQVTRASATAMTVRITAEHGARESQFQIVGDELRLQVQVSSARLDSPVQWALGYVPVSSPPR